MDGKIKKISDYLLRELTYEYDSNDHLISATEVDGDRAKFTYDNENRMTSLIFSDGSKVDTVYDPKTGFVTKQSGPGQKVTTYAYGKDGERFWAAVEDNEGGKSRYEYLDSDNKIIFTDKAGKKTITTLSACCGKPVSIVNEKGVGNTFIYDDVGNLISKTDIKHHTTKFSYEPRFNRVSEIKLYDGSYIRFIFDKNGNLALSRSSTGEHVKLVNEPHGKILSMMDQRDVQIRFEYNRFGKATLIEKLKKGKKVGAMNILYDKGGEILKVETEPKKPEVIQDIKDSLASFLRFLKPSGIDFEI